MLDLSLCSVTHCPSNHEHEAEACSPLVLKSGSGAPYFGEITVIKQIARRFTSILSEEIETPRAASCSKSNILNFIGTRHSTLERVLVVVLTAVEQRAFDTLHSSERYISQHTLYITT